MSDNSIAILLNEGEHNHLCEILKAKNDDPIAGSILKKFTTNLQSTVEEDNEAGWLKGLMSIDLNEHLDIEKINEDCDDVTMLFLLKHQAVIRSFMVGFTLHC